MHVCVIGAGAAGLCSARHLASMPDMTFDVFEQTGRVGGTWVFTEEIDKDEFGLPIHSSMYGNLRVVNEYLHQIIYAHYRDDLMHKLARSTQELGLLPMNAEFWFGDVSLIETNLPKESMQFPDFPFKELNDSFIHHSEVLNYLEGYAHHFNIYKNIQFYTHVQNVETQQYDRSSYVWLVTVEDLKTKQCKTREYDAVFVCNGHYSEPYIPEIPNIENFVGLTMHSHSYRDPKVFENKTVVILGAAASGIDITLELSSYSKQIYLSHKLENNIRGLPESITQVPQIVSASKDGFTFSNGTEVIADVLIYCTGYKYSFPFLSGECRVDINDRRVTPLYKHVIHTEFPTLYFIGIPFIVLPFPLFDIQVRFCIKCLDGTIVLPSKEDMNADIENDYKHKISTGIPHRHAHKLGDTQWKYFDELALRSNTDLLSPIYKKLYEGSRKRRVESVIHYKKDHYTILDNDTFIADYYNE